MQHQFLGLSAAIPDNWQDRSTITFEIPPDPSMSPGNVVITWSNGDDVEAYLHGQEKALPSMLERFSVVQRGLTRDIDYIEFTFEAAGQTIRQIMLAKRIDARIVAVTGTALAVRFASLREQFVDVAASLKSAPS